MYITTTNGFDGRVIKEYKGIVFGEAIAITSVYSDMADCMSNPYIGITGGRKNYNEYEFSAIRTEAINEMIERAKKMGANAIVGVRVDIDEINSKFLITASGTAVIV